jgi:gamma-glutamyl phosphate reductase
VTLARELAPGLELRRLSSPIGVLCIIFEARPEAVVQISTLALKSGNAVILKGGKEAAASNAILVDVIRGAIASVPASGEHGAAAVPADAVQLVSTREEVADLLRLDEYIDVSSRRVVRRGAGRANLRIKRGRISVARALMQHPPPNAYPPLPVPPAACSW